MNITPLLPPYAPAPCPRCSKPADGHTHEPPVCACLEPSIFDLDAETCGPYCRLAR